jgi:23S rRNA (guanosine2251-2'-O)-methyltransferase
MLRTGWLTGVAGILIPDDRAVGLTPSVCKVASGGAEHVPVESFTNLPSAIQDLKNAGFWVYGLSEKGVRKPWEFKLPKKVAWIVGSEGGGMRITTERACDELVKIPQVESGSSYNAAVAMAMALAETCRQFGKPE